MCSAADALYSQCQRHQHTVGLCTPAIPASIEVALSALPREERAVSLTVPDCTCAKIVDVLLSVCNSAYAQTRTLTVTGINGTP